MERIKGIFNHLTILMEDSPVLREAVYILLLLAIAWIIYLAFSRLIIRTIERITSRTETEWDDILFQRRVFHPFIYIAPASAVYLGSGLLPFSGDIIRRAALVLIIVNVIGVFSKILNGIVWIFKRKDSNRPGSLTSLIQVAVIFLYVAGFLAVISIILDRSPTVLIGGLGAFAAVLMLIFKETILSVVSSVQIQMNDIVRVGDWIEMPKYGVDGDIIDMTLHTIKVQNFDKTISTVPITCLVNDSVKNWRGMVESGGRRIKRSLLIDQNSIRLITAKDLERLSQVEVLNDYLKERLDEIEEHNKGHKVLTEINGRGLTNIGLFRVYIKKYLEKHPLIRNDMTFMVRQLAPDSEKGLPLQVYVFTNDTDWVRYEEIQSDVFDHLLAVMHEFGLRAFQRSASLKEQGV